MYKYLASELNGTQITFQNIEIIKLLSWQKSAKLVAEEDTI